jgi:hypothetical protein
MEEVLVASSFRSCCEHYSSFHVPRVRQRLPTGSPGLGPQKRQNSEIHQDRPGQPSTRAPLSDHHPCPARLQPRSFPTPGRSIPSPAPRSPPAGTRSVNLPDPSRPMTSIRTTTPTRASAHPMQTVVFKALAISRRMFTRSQVPELQRLVKSVRQPWTPTSSVGEATR